MSVDFLKDILNEVGIINAVGYDIGSQNCAIAVANHSEIDILLNDESKRETPAVVSFGEKQRFLGSAGAAFATKYPKSTVSQIKRLIGRLYKDPSVQEELKFLPFDTSEGPNGGVLIHLQYLSKRWTFRPVEILGMLFAHLKQLTEKNLGSRGLVDCVVGIPSYFTGLQRREYHTAARIGGLYPFRLIHDCTAVALGYGIDKTDFSNKRPTNVIFVDIGHSDTQVTVAAFQETKLEILSHAFDQNLGGRDFDEVLFTHFAAQFKEKYNINFYANVRASIRLRESCENLKKVLSANAEAPLSIECLIDEQDVNGFITRQEFEKLSSDLLERVTIPCRKALHDSGLSVKKIHSIELVGSGSRIPAIKNILTSLFRKEPVRTLNGSECVARGCAIRSAMLSPSHEVRYLQIQDMFPYSIALCLVDNENQRHPEIMLFPKGSRLPTNHEMCYNGYNTCHLEVLYTNEADLPTGISPIVGRFKVGPYQTGGGEKVKGSIKVQLNHSGIVEVEPALHGEAREEWYRRRNFVVSENLCVLTTIDELCEAQEREEILKEQDIRVERSKEKRNSLESFIYNSRSKVKGLYRRFVFDSEEKIISESLKETEEWLYEEGDDESEQVYTQKLEDLKKLLDPIEYRYKEENDRIEAIKTLKTCIKENRLEAYSLPLSKKKEVDDECITQLQESLPNYATPVYGSTAINLITQVFKRRCKDKIISNRYGLLNSD